MKLNNSSHVHKLIRTKSKQLELLSNMKLVTDFDDDFTQIQFLGKYGYITIDWKRNAIYTLGIRLDKIEFQLAHDLIIYCDWLETGERVLKRIKFKGEM